MIISPVEQTAALTVGTVETVSPDAIEVVLDDEAPQVTALNAGVPIAFPRVNGYVLVPSEIGAVVGLISRITIHRLDYSKRTGYKDHGLIDLPFPLRKMMLTPVGTLVIHGAGATGEHEFELQRGVPVLPSVGDTIRLPTERELGSIIEAVGVNRRVHIGFAPFANNAKVTVDPDKLFGRHLAILGNTGSGKSCTVAGLIRWSLAAAEQARESLDRKLNARFIVLDPNGEYARVFSDGATPAQVFAVGGAGGARPLTVPGWMWNSQEWLAFTGAQPGAQRPTLIQALRVLRYEAASADILKRQIAGRYHGRLRQLQRIYSECPDSVINFPANANFAATLQAIAELAKSDLS